MKPTLVLRGVQVFQGLLDRDVQSTIVDDIRGIVAKAPLFSPMTPYGAIATRVSIRTERHGLQFLRPSVRFGIRCRGRSVHRSVVW